MASMATQYARHMVLEWGMSKRLGFVNYAGADTQESFIPEKDYSDETARIIDEARDLLSTTRDCLELGVQQMVSGNRLSDIGHAVQQRAESSGYGVVRQFVGHGIGRVMHELPQVPNYGRPGRGPRLLPGMVLAIEPMVNVGTEAVRMLDDAWTAVTANRSKRATSSRFIGPP